NTLNNPLVPLHHTVVVFADLLRAATHFGVLPRDDDLLIEDRQQGVQIICVDRVGQLFFERAQFIVRRVLLRGRRRLGGRRQAERPHEEGAGRSDYEPLEHDDRLPLQSGYIVTIGSNAVSLRSPRIVLWPRTGGRRSIASGGTPG